MPTSDRLVEFLITVYALILIPGPSVLFVVSRGVTLGRRAALVTVLGNTIGLALQLALVGIGMGAFVTRSDAVFTTLKLIGAGYLLYLGVSNIRHRKTLAHSLIPGQQTPKPLSRILREGFYVGATNPKGVLMFTAVVPQFIDRSNGHVTIQLATLGSICVLIGLISDSAWALASGTVRGWLGRSSGRLETMNGMGGAMLVGLGVALLVTERKK